MTDSSHDPEKPKKSQPTYLPRIKYQEPEPEAAAEAEYSLEAGHDPELAKKKPAIEAEPLPKAPKKSAEMQSPIPKKKKAKALDHPKRGAIDGDRDKERTGVLIEPTPELDTYESRKRMRLIVGAVAAGLILLTLFVLFRSLRSTESSDEDLASQQFVYPPKPASAVNDAALESQAKQLLDDAQQYEKRGKMEQALDRLAKITKDYPKTASAKRAAECRERYEQGLPLFPGGPAVVAKKGESKQADPKPDPAKPVEVVAAPPMPATPPGPVVVELAPPPFPPDPRRETGVSLSRANAAANPLPAGFRPRPEAGIHASGWPLEITCDKDGAAMVLVPGDTFTQGRDDGPAESKPAHKVRLSTYYIDQHEVTARQFQAFQGKPPSEDMRPAVNVSLNDAKVYAEWAGKSIPTEAQWEMGARSIDARMHPWGNQPPSWSKPRKPQQIDPVMSYEGDLSPYGAYDLAGNTWEWTSDWFETKYYQQFKGAIPSNPSGPAKGKSRVPEVVIKGGSKDWEASWRAGRPPNAKLPYLGFRCVLNVETAPQETPAPTPPPTTTNATPPKPASGMIPF